MLGSRSRDRRSHRAERQLLLLPQGPSHRRHLRHHRGHQARLLDAGSRVVQPRAGAARDRAAPRRARRVHAVPVARGRSGVRAGPGPLGAARGDRRPLQPALPQGPAVAVPRRERLHLGRRPHLAHARGGQPRAREPRPLPPRLHRLRGAARPLPDLHAHPHPARGRARLRLHRRRPAARDHRARPLGAAHLEPVQPHRQAGAGRGAVALGRGGARARLRPADRRVLLALRLDRRARAAAGGERRALRRGRGPRPGRPLRRPHQELALPGLAGHLDGRRRAR